MFSVLIRPFGLFSCFHIVTSERVVPGARRQRLYARWQCGADGRLRCTWESVAKPPTDEDAAPDFRVASRNPSLASATRRRPHRARRLGKPQQSRVTNEGSNDTTACSRCHLAA
jgi:hypothetical protein